ncbi:DUF3618 domain-containing protein [Nocardiopsis kunsanensis]|uniref:DUF3618 domain-containing protein n=1 Tax=Nocardiopsis kunsanensis TaxID=141693 RepID=A0A918XA52_9ACTN|nr:DUF3618 domain-containing protein [Nocardiopsis kunsanensis]GHD20966.1 hypothetical protein GCM10007147_13840 [Nocardiopsis kunsanensis]
MSSSDTIEPRQTPAEIQAEIDREQRRFAETLDALEEAARPGNIARRQLGKARERGARLVDEARALVLGGGAVRLESRLVEPEEGTIVVKGDEEVITTYQSRSQLPPEAIILAAGVGTVVAVGAVAWAVRRKRK